ncbi:MAG: ribonuclease Y [Pseudomonadales bacterium]|jgi:ribonuclease Y|nr:ribonuclease Y [Pseudomonadales bacterium]
MSFFNNLSTLFGAQADSAKKRQGAPTGNKQAPDNKFKNNKQQKNKNVAKQNNNQQPQQVKQPVAPAVNQVELDTMVREAQAKAREIVVEAKDEALAIRIKAEKDAQLVTRQVEEQQKDLTSKIDRIDARLSQLDQKEEHMDKEKTRLDEAKKQLEENKKQVLTKLEEASKMTRDEARAYLLDTTQKKITSELAQIVRQKEEEAKAEADDKAREILIDSMKYGATDFVPEYTMSTVALGSEDAKGKIIGKNGRNIHAFERATGVDVDLDVSPTEVKLSCFDPVRREIARISLEKLIKDGRIQPSRIEEIVAKTTKELDRVMFEEGKKLCHAVGIYNLPNELMQMLGRFKYRFSYGQNLISHTLEETRLGIKIAHELGLNVNVVKLGCLLHDIGKVSDEVDGSHVELGVKIAKRFNLPQPVIDCIAQHHEDEPFTGAEQIAVYVADAISGARPGARYENYDEYVQRLQKLEEIANAYPEVQKSYAVQAGREIRVILEPAKSKDDDVVVLSDKIRDEIKEQVTYPGTVTVTVIRETRGQAIAK